MSANSLVEDVLSFRAENTKGLGVGTWLFVLFLVALLIFLAFPLEESQLPPWAVTLQTILRAGVPYVIVALLGGSVGLSEIASTFPSYPREALHARWARLLVLVNILLCTVAFWVARLFAPQVNVALLVIGIGVGFQVLIRTHFTLARQLGGTGGVSFNFGWLYDQFQRLCKTQIDRELMNSRLVAVEGLLERFPSLAELYSVALYTITTRTTLTAEERQGKLAELEELFGSQAPAYFVRANLALSILENGGLVSVDPLFAQPASRTQNGATTAGLAKQLMEKYSLNELVYLTQQMTDSTDVHSWVEQAAQPVEDLPEAGRKATVAHVLVQHAGMEAVQRLLEG
jgi:hypothetical protein